MQLRAAIDPVSAGVALDQVPDVLWARLDDFISAHLGLHYPPARRADLQRGLAAAARTWRLDDGTACINWLLASPPDRDRLQVLARHLTIGETYFFREAKTFAALAERVLPELIQARRGGHRRLRLWSAACCTGEEAYSLAILLQQLVPDLADWSVTILATDINELFLRKATAGIYGQWSFRDTPSWMQERFFRRVADGRMAVTPETQRMVTFASLNLVDDSYPSLATDTNAMDVILCRNVLMYFSPAQIPRVLRKLHRALIDGGWLIVSPSEASHGLFTEYETVNLPGVILYRKSSGMHRDGGAEQIAAPADVAETWTAPAPVIPPEEPQPAKARDAIDRLREDAAAQFGAGRYADAAAMLQRVLALARPEPRDHALLVRALANLGRLEQAGEWCERWIAADKLDATAHYMHAMIRLELDDADGAAHALRRALYLQPHFVVVHLALGNLARKRGRHDEAVRHFGNVLSELRRFAPDELVPEADGLTAGRFAEMVAAMQEAPGAA